MKLHNKGKDGIVRHGSAKIETDHKGARVLRSKLIDVSDLAFEVEVDDDGGDPYNSTGKHVALPDFDD